MEVEALKLFLLFVARINLQDFCDREPVPKRIGAET
jgi:hypothetical protein